MRKTDQFNVEQLPDGTLCAYKTHPDYGADEDTIYEYMYPGDEDWDETQVQWELRGMDNICSWMKNKEPKDALEDYGTWVWHRYEGKDLCKWDPDVEDLETHLKRMHTLMAQVDDGGCTASG